MHKSSGRAMKKYCLNWISLLTWAENTIHLAIDLIIINVVLLKLLVQIILSNCHRLDLYINTLDNKSFNEFSWHNNNPTPHFQRLLHIQTRILLAVHSVKKNPFRLKRLN